jgi:hypothetical protein
MATIGTHKRAGGNSIRGDGADPERLRSNDTFRTCSTAGAVAEELELGFGSAEGFRREMMSR